MTRLGMLAVSIASLVLPATASAEFLVPPGNSAATQYTEALPTAGGHSNAENPGKKGNRTPSEVLGAHKAKQLESHGEAGREAAEFAAESAPAEEVAASPEAQPEPEASPDHHGGNRKKKGESHEQGEGTPAAGNGSGDGPGGSSGLGEVVSQATGSSSGQLGLLLAIVGAAAWAVAFLLRQRKTTDSIAAPQP